MKNVLQSTSSTQYQIIQVNLSSFQIAPTLTTPKKKSSKGTLKILKNKTFFQKKIDWGTVFSDCKQDVDLSHKKFLDKITKLLDIHAPVKKLSHKEKKSLSKPWLTKGILQSMKEKNVLYRKFNRTKNLTIRELLLLDFKIQKNTIHKLTRINKSEFYKHYFEEHTNNSKKPGVGLDLLSVLKKTLINKSDP